MKSPKNRKELGRCNYTYINQTSVGIKGNGQGKQQLSGGEKVMENIKIQSIINTKKGEIKMKIAVPVTSTNQVDDHFGHCEFYSVFTVSDENQITKINIIPSVQGCGCKSNIASVLAADGVTIMLAGGIGGGAINVLANSGIEVIRGCSGDAQEVVKNFISGLITDSGESCHQHESHHGEGGGHQCSH